MNADTPDERITSHTRRAYWAWWGVAAGLLGIVATLLTDGSQDLSEAEYRQGAALIDLLDRDLYHMGVVAGFFTVLCLLFTAAGWRRWADERAPASLPARVISLALTASAGALMLGYGFKGSLAVYLDGGLDEGSMAPEGLYAVFMFLDFGPFIGWWGAAIAAAVIAWLSLRDRLLARWMGIVSALFAIVPIGMLIGTGLPGFPGVVDSLWLAIVSLGLAVSRGARVVQTRSGEPARRSAEVAAHPTASS
jgi:hypothetical protein